MRGPLSCARHLRAPAILLLLAGQWGAPPAWAAQEAPQAVADAIRQAATATAPPNAQITLGPVMGAHFMPACTAALTITISGDEPYQQAAAHCTAPAWTLYVTLTVDARMAVVVAARSIAGGQTLETADLALREEPISLYAGRRIFYHPEDAIGGLAVMSLPAGAILTASNIEQPLIVKAGQTISINVRSGDVDVTITGRADESGRLGDTIAVTNPSSGKQFEALVTRAGALVQLAP
jgi:flagella basal body P-ring formation protein FlgA